MYLTYDSSDTWEFPGVEAFRSWLEGMDPSLTLAKDWGWTGCPVWTFLRCEGWASPTVYRWGEWHPQRQFEVIDDTFKMPPWASEFVWLSDLIKPRTMRVQDCLNLLDNPLFKPANWENGKSRPQMRISPLETSR
jgi:hypothetical protein